VPFFIIRHAVSQALRIIMPSLNFAQQAIYPYSFYLHKLLRICRKGSGMPDCFCTFLCSMMNEAPLVARQTTTFSAVSLFQVKRFREKVRPVPRRIN
jgi:hypothetical protein